MNKNDGPKKNEGRWICLYILAIIGIAGLIHLLMSPSIPSISSIDAPTWLTFWGSYLGGAIGCLPAIAALQHSRREARRQCEKEQEDSRRSVMPVIDCRICDGPRECFSPKSDNAFAVNFHGYFHEEDDEEWLLYEQNPLCNFLELCNCGLGPALQVKLTFNNSSVDLFHLKNGHTFHYILDLSYPYFCALSTANSPIIFEVDFFDIYGNHYSQSIEFKCHPCFEDKNTYLSFRTISVNTPKLLSQ